MSCSVRSNYQRRYGLIHGLRTSSRNRRTLKSTRSTRSEGPWASPAHSRKTSAVCRIATRSQRGLRARTLARTGIERGSREAASGHSLESSKSARADALGRMIIAFCSSLAALALKSAWWSSPVSLLASEPAGATAQCNYCGTANQVPASALASKQVIRCSYCHRRFLASPEPSSLPDRKDGRD